MRNRYLSLIFSSLFLANFGFAQGVCGTFEGYLEEDKEKHPGFYQSLEGINADLERQHKLALSKMTHLKSENGRKIIPVVVHVIHDMGSENISDESIQGAIDILNENINGQASNFLSKTPDVFAAFRGDLNVEFRLAKIDPDGNPTTGINRVRSSLTDQPDPANSVKRLSYWNSYQYFNIWTVKRFLPQDDGNTLLGYAQFPWSGSMSTDGVVLLSSQMVSGGTLTHETGHWLGLRHTWGDNDCGDDNVSDTPPAYGPNFGIDLSDFPYHVGSIGIGSGCLADSMNWAGEMFVNYMDYSDDADVTMFTIGQNDVMNETLEGLEGEFGYREYLWSYYNVTDSTGAADGYKPPICSQQASFNFSGGTSPIVCEGERIFLQGNKGQFGLNNVTSFVWDFGNGVTDNSGSNNIQYIYPELGSYDIGLTVQYNETVQATAYSLSDLDLVNATSYDSIVTDKLVQGTESELNALGVANPTEISIDSLGVYFGMEDSSYFRGTIPSVVYIAYYSNTCTSSVLKEDFIVIGPTTSANSASSYNYSFESENELSEDWNVVSSTDVPSIWSFNSSEPSSWEWINGVARQGSAAIKINGDKIASGSHEIVSVAYDLGGLSDPAIKFSWSGAADNTFPVNELKVYYSNNCGEDWFTLGSLSAVEAANAGLYSVDFSPKANEWRDIIMKKSQLQDNNIRFKFEYVVNGSGNNFYLDNIQIGEEASLFQSQFSTVNKLSVFPNPTDGKATIIIENLAELDVQISLVNILGAEVKQLFDGISTSNSQAIDTDLSLLDKGVYFIKVIHKGDIILTDKLLLTK